MLRSTRATAGARYVDLWYEPEPENLHVLAQFGLVHRIAGEGACSLEFWHQPPNALELFRSLGKHAFLCELAEEQKQSFPLQWLVSAGRPDTLLNDPRLFAPLEGWPPGVYSAAPTLRQHLIVLRELPVLRETLVLRLFGAGATLKQAVRELRALPENAPERGVMLPLLVRFHIELAATSATPEEQEYLMETRDLVAEFEERAVARGVEQGIERALVRLLAARFGPLDTQTLARLEGASKAELERWLDGVLTADSLASLLR